MHQIIWNGDALAGGVCSVQDEFEVFLVLVESRNISKITLLFGELNLFTPFELVAEHRSTPPFQIIGARVYN